MNQKAIYIKDKSVDGVPKPKKLWCLKAEPKLPFNPIDAVNATLEDPVNDYNWSKGKLRWHSRNGNPPSWLLIEF